jgi:hypothetical protein
VRSISREIELPIGADAAFALLHTPSAIRAWWSAERVLVVPRHGGIWVAAWGPDEDSPDYITAARIVVWDPPRTLRLGHFQYYRKDGQELPFVAALETEFSVSVRDSGSLLRVHQVGFPDESIADAFFVSCQAGWAATFEGIQRYVVNTPAPQDHLT